MHSPFLISGGVMGNDSNRSIIVNSLPWAVCTVVLSEGYDGKQLAFLIFVHGCNWDGRGMRLSNKETAYHLATTTHYVKEIKRKFLANGYLEKLKPLPDQGRAYRYFLSDKLIKKAKKLDPLLKDYDFRGMPQHAPSDIRGMPQHTPDKSRDVDSSVDNLLTTCRKAVDNSNYGVGHSIPLRVCSTVHEGYVPHDPTLDNIKDNIKNKKTSSSSNSDHDQHFTHSLASVNSRFESQRLSKQENLNKRKLFLIEECAQTLSERTEDELPRLRILELLQGGAK